MTKKNGVTPVTNISHGGWQDTANMLSTPDHTVSRQQIYAWWIKRDRNGFPDRHLINGRRVFIFSEVIEWYKTYTPSKGGRPLGVKNKQKNIA